MQNDFAVHRRLENGAVGLEFLAQLRGVGQVAVMRDGDLAARAIDRERLGVAQVRESRSSNSAYGRRPCCPTRLCSTSPSKTCEHQPHALVGPELSAVA